MTWFRKGFIVLGLALAVQASTTGQSPLAHNTTATTPNSTQSTLKKSISSAQKPWMSPYLPNTLQPINYEVELWPWLFRESSSSLFLFHGRSKVTFRCLNRTNIIVIHSRSLNYTKPVKVTRMDNSTITVRRLWEERANEYLVLILRSHLQKGKVYTLHTAFCGELTDDLTGLYRCEYEEDGTTK
ncbi:aminopeptidase Ey-like [Heptranchias perlo]|uniref:aminopeptidase Ey-like n=1 Tax=Heptranchias perlo TaxID=212740 RepID=UPI00355ACA83